MCRDVTRCRRAIKTHIRDLKRDKSGDKMERRYNIEDARYSLDDMNYYRNKIGCRLG